MIMPPTKTIAVDVDGTLLLQGNVANFKLIEWVKLQKKLGAETMLWSARGRKHAVETATRLGVEDIFDVICSKPGYIIDDKGWGWIKYTIAITNMGDLKS